MKITCSACNASYNLPDEKVAGRRVKVRCKKCSEPIIVDGSRISVSAAGFDDEEATRVMESPLQNAAKMWTVNLSETEQGDMTDEELVAGWQAGIVTEEAYVWREGMDDWAPILDVPELVSLLRQAEERPSQASSEAPAEPVRKSSVPPAKPRISEPGPGVASTALEESSEPERESTPPKRESSPPERKSAVPRPDQISSVQAKSPSSPFASPFRGEPEVARTTRKADTDLFAEKPKPKREKPKYEAAAARNENSVLFSLEALKAAAASKSSDEPVPSARADEDLLTMGGTGLDTNLAPLIQIDAPSVTPEQATGSGTPAAFSGAASAMPPPRKRGGVGAFVGGVLATAVVAAGGFYVYQTMGADQKTDAANQAPSVEPKEPTSTLTKPAASERKESEGSAAGGSGNDDSTSEDAENDSTKDREVSAARADRDPSPRTSPSPAPVKAENDRGEASSDKEDSTASGSSPSPKEPSSSSGSQDKKEEKKEDDKAPFSTDAARTALSNAAAQAKACKASDGPTGTGKVQVTFVPSGRVTVATVVSGPFGGTTVGGCVARTFRRARVPPFSGDAVSVAMSFSIE